MHISLYIHFPFCLQKCLYCDFNSVADAQVVPGEYVAAVVHEMELLAERLPVLSTAPTLYFGGGTPSLMEADLVERVVDTAARLYGLQPDAEITIEANPGTLTRGKLADYRSACVNRLSLGVQSFDDRMLTRLGRIHTSRQALESFAAARNAGFANIGIDLIHSLPGETPAMWQDDLNKAVALETEHISAYGLSVEEGTPFHALERSGELMLPDEDAALLMFQQTTEFLESAGFEHYEISNFARPGFRSRHNQVYWQRGNYLGFGAGAHSFMNSPDFGIRWKNPDSPALYMQAVNRAAPLEEEKSVLTEREAMAERFFLGLRMLDGVDGGLFQREFGITPEEAYPAQLSRLLSDGLVEWRKGCLRLTDRGLIISNQVFMKFL
ncbi:MAG: oxygen-independent coproporphyrinogen III [Geobacteraceae bacterium]|nr:MAG: oxygen-independent coproporphyrinogen III [Geobacteraceae bacterium]